jgi:hypothetical protein
MRDPDCGPDQRHAQEEQARLEVKEDEDGAGEEHQIREKREKRIGGDPLHLGDVVVEAGENVPHGNRRVEPGR